MPRVKINRRNRKVKTWAKVVTGTDRQVFECELGNHVYDFVSLRDNMKSCSVYLSVADLREISNKAAKAAGRVLDRIMTQAK